jgi:hypothetical protein
VECHLGEGVVLPGVEEDRVQHRHSLWHVARLSSERLGLGAYLRKPRRDLFGDAWLQLVCAYRHGLVRASALVFLLDRAAPWQQARAVPDLSESS